MDLRRLREETRPEHEATESVLPLTAPDLTLGEYTKALRAMLPIVASWERWAAENAPERLRVLLARRLRSHLIVRDLEVLGGLGVPGVEAGEAAGHEIDWAAVITPERGGAAPGAIYDAAFLGSLYVMEGSTLGGRFIARHVESALGFQPGEGDAYFQGHGEETGSLWREVTAEIAAVPEDDAEWLIQAAKRTFAAFGEALRSGIPVVP